MGSSQSTDSTTTIENAVIEQYLQELQKLNSDLTAMKDENLVLKGDLLKVKGEFSTLKCNFDETTRNADTLQSEQRRNNALLGFYKRHFNGLNLPEAEEFSKLKENLDETTTHRDILLREIAKKNSELLEKTSIADESKRELLGLTVEIENTRKQLQAVSDDVGKLKQKGYSLQEENDNLRKRNIDLHSELSNLNEELKKVKNQLKQASEKEQRDKRTLEAKTKTFDKKYNLMNSQNCKLQSQLMSYTSNEAVVQIVALYQQLQKLASQTDSTVKKLTTEIQTQKHIADEVQLQEQSYEYYQLIEKLEKHNITLSNTNFSDSVKKYKSVCEENDKKVKDLFKRIYEINTDGKNLCKQIKTNLSEVVDKIKPIMEAYQKEINELKQKSFVNDYKQEEKLYTEALEMAQKEKIYFNNLLCVPTETHPDTVKNNLNNKKKETKKKILNTDLDSKTSEFISSNTSGGGKSQEACSLNVFEKDKCDDYKIIVYDFPESEHPDADKADTDLINIRYLFGKLGLGDIKDIRVQRLPIPKNYKIRPLVVSLPSLEATQRILNCSELLTQNIRIARFNGKIIN